MTAQALINASRLPSPIMISPDSLPVSRET